MDEISLYEIWKQQDSFCKHLNILVIIHITINHIWF